MSEPVVTEAVLRMAHEHRAAKPWEHDLEVRLHPIAYKRLVEESELVAPSLSGPSIAGMPIIQDADLNPEQIVVEPLP